MKRAKANVVYLCDLERSNVWSTVEIAITNHAAGGLTELDLEFARRVNALV